MAAIYYRRVKNGQMKLEHVPERWRGMVAGWLLEDLGFVNTGNGLVGPDSDLGRAILEAIGEK